MINKFLIINNNQVEKAMLLNIYNNLKIKKIFLLIIIKLITCNII